MTANMLVGDGSQERLSEAKELYQRGELGPACAKLEQLVGEVPGFAPAWAMLGSIALDNQDAASAVTLLAHACELAPREPDYLVLLYQACSAAGQLQEAEDCLHLLAEHWPERVGAPERQQVAPAGVSSGLLPLETLRYYTLRALYQEAILCCVAGDVEAWWAKPGLELVFACESTRTLRRLLSDPVLRGAGDHRAFLRLSAALDGLGAPASFEDFFLARMARRFERDLTLIRSTVAPMPGERPLLLDLTVWGGPYIQRFLDYCLPSLLAAGNLEAACARRKVILLVHTDAAGEAQLRAAPGVARAQALGLELRCLPLDPELLQLPGDNGNFKYWHLGMTQSLGLAYARQLGADFHALFPDCVFGEHYFAALLRIVDSGVQAVLHTAFRTDIEAIGPVLQSCREDGRLRVPAGDLMALGLDCLHPTMRHLRANDRPEAGLWPAFHALMWESEGSLSLASPHLSAAWLDHALLKDLPERYYFTVDSEIEKIVDPARMYMPTLDDAMAIIELSPVVPDAEPGGYVDAHGFAALFWSRVESPKHLAFMQRPIVFPVSTALRSQPRKLLSTAQIAAEVAEVCAIVTEIRPRSHLPAMMNGLLSLHLAETHSLAQGRFADLHRTAARIWEHGRALLDTESETAPDQAMQTIRMLWHFGLLAEARTALQQCAPPHFLIPEIDRWQHDVAVNCTWAQEQSQVRFVIGSTVWGDAYLDFYLGYHLASLLAPGNIPALARRGRVLLSVVTNAAGQRRIEASEVYARLCAHADIRFTCIAALPHQSDHDHRRWFYMHYGLLDHHHVMLAKALNADLCLMPVDTVISGQGFAVLADAVEEGYDCCTVACIEAYRRPLLPALRELRGDGVLDADADTLMRLAVSQKTAYFKSLLVAPETQLNMFPREFFWRVPGGYVCHSLFMHPIMLSARVLSRDFIPNHENTDWALLPRVLQADGKVKVLEDSGGLFILHCSEENERAGEILDQKGVITPELGAYLLGVHRHDYPIHRELFKRGTFFPVDDPEVPFGSYLADVTLLQAMFAVTRPATAPVPHGGRP